MGMWVPRGDCPQIPKKVLFGKIAEIMPLERHRVVGRTRNE